MITDTVVIRGAGDIATGIGHRLHRCGYKVLHLDIEKPLVIRRTVAFTEAIFNGSGEIDGVKCMKVENLSEIKKAWENDLVAVMIDPEAKIIDELKPDVVVDAIIAKKNIGTNKSMAKTTIAIGPGFVAGKDVDVVVESNRGHFLGSIILKGSAAPNTGEPGNIAGFTTERVIRANEDGVIKNIREIADIVKQGEIIATIGDSKILASLDGVLRGLITDGTEVFKGLKIADVDPRGDVSYCYTITEKARAIGGAVLEGILHMEKLRRNENDGNITS